MIRIITKIRKQKEDKKLYGYFKQQFWETGHKMIWKWLRRGNLGREIEFLLIGAQNNAIRSNYLKAKIDKTQQNSKCRLCGNKDETVNHIISECSKLVQKYARPGTTG